MRDRARISNSRQLYVIISVYGEISGENLVIKTKTMKDGLHGFAVIRLDRTAGCTWQKEHQCSFRGFLVFQYENKQKECRFHFEKVFHSYNKMIINKMNK